MSDRKEYKLFGWITLEVIDSPEGHGLTIDIVSIVNFFAIMNGLGSPGLLGLDKGICVGMFEIVLESFTVYGIMDSSSVGSGDGLS